MTPITNPKVETVDPTWARFVGWSLLFDNPGDSLRPDGRLETMHCDVDSGPELALYRELSRAVAGFKRDEPDDLCLCLLPPHSYHVTFFDCGNQANAEGAHPEHQSALAELLKGFPESWSEDHELIVPSTQNAVALATSLNISFRYSRLLNWNHGALVAVLEPSDEGSKTNLGRLIEQRAALSDEYRRTYGFGALPKYTPHISLAYFANKAGGERAAEKTEEWDHTLRARTNDIQIRFNSVSAYAFTDMATFFREKLH